MTLFYEIDFLAFILTCLLLHLLAVSRHLTYIGFDILNIINEIDLAHLKGLIRRRGFCILRLLNGSFRLAFWYFRLILYLGLTANFSQLMVKLFDSLLKILIAQNRVMLPRLRLNFGNKANVLIFLLDHLLLMLQFFGLTLYDLFLLLNDLLLFILLFLKLFKFF